MRIRKRTKKTIMKMLLKDFDLKLKVKNGSDYAVVFDDDLLPMEVIVPEKAPTDLCSLITNKEIRKIKGIANMDLFSMLHEIGHILTTTDELLAEHNLLEAILAELYNEGKITEEEMVKSYMKIPSEEIANDFAAHWVFANRERVLYYNTMF